MISLSMEADGHSRELSGRHGLLEEMKDRTGTELTGWVGWGSPTIVSPLPVSR